MRKGVFNISVSMLLALLIIAPCLAQQRNPQMFPVVNGGKSDGLPEKLIARGTISRVNYAPPRCGELIFAATFEIKLDTKLRGYDHPFLYLVVPCLYQPEGTEKFLGQHVEIAATKQYEKRQPCFFDIESNSINSRGVPFYCAKREELLKSVTGSQAVSPAEYEGWLEEGSTYHASVTCDEVEGWRTVVPFRIPFHHAVRIEWTNLSEFPQLDKAKNDDCQRRLVFKVIKKETTKASGQNRWNTTYECKIIAVD